MTDIYKNLNLDNIIYFNNEGVKCEEVWKSIIGFTSYEISDLGRIKSKNYRRTGLSKIRRQGICKGYLHLDLYHNGKPSYFMTHRLVAEAFIPNPENKPEVNHKKGIKTDNRASELEWNTSSENSQHSFDSGLRIIPVGELAYNSKLTDKIVLEILSLTSSVSQRKLAKIYGVAHTTIRMIVKRRTWSHL